MGKTAAIQAADLILSLYEVGTIAVIGIAGGLSGDVAIGDICITGTMIDILDNAKVSGGGGATRETEFNPKFYSTDNFLALALNYAQIGSDIKPAFEDWQLESCYEGKKLIEGEFLGRGGKNETISLPKLHSGNIVCGSVAQSEEYAHDLQQIDRKVLAVETEGGGIFHRANRRQIPVVSIRGICDYADGNKKLLEEQTGSVARVIAADNAVSFFKMQLRNPQLLRFLSGRRDRSSYQISLLEETDSDIKFIGGALRTARATIHQQLTLLSPEYHGKAEGYRLPPSARETVVIKCHCQHGH